MDGPHLTHVVYPFFGGWAGKCLEVCGDSGERARHSGIWIVSHNGSIGLTVANVVEGNGLISAYKV